MRKLSESEFKGVVKDMKKSNDKRFFIDILEYKLADYHLRLEDVACDDRATSILRGSILEIRELLDLVK